MKVRAQRKEVDAKAGFVGTNNVARLPKMTSISMCVPAASLPHGIAETDTGILSDYGRKEKYEEQKNVMIASALMSYN